MSKLFHTTQLVLYTFAKELSKHELSEKMSSQQIIDLINDKSTNPLRKYTKAFQDLKDNGYAVIEGVVSPEECASAFVRIKDFMREAKIDVDSPKLKMSSYPNSHGIVQHLEAGQMQAIWDIRLNKNVLDVFQEMWGDNDLLSSTDGFCWMPSHYKGIDKSWLHVDQSHKKEGLQCIQGYVNLLTSHDDASGSLYVIPGSHKKHANFPKTDNKDWYKFKERELDSFDEIPVRVHGGVGSLVLWDSRTAHSAIPPSSKAEKTRERCVVYVCYQPRRLCSAKNLDKKRMIFENYRMTTHWPASKVEMFGVKWRTYGAEITVETPERTRIPSQRMLEIAGVLPMTSQPHRVSTPALEFNLIGYD